MSYLGVATLDGADLSGLSGKLEDGATPHNGLGGLSAIAWAGQGNNYLVMPDRGPNAYAYPGGELVDKTKSYINRVHSVQVDVTQDVNHGWLVAVHLTGTTLLGSATSLTGSEYGNAERRYFTGLSSGMDAMEPTRSMRLDPEGLRVASDGESFFVSDEYGPFLYQFARRSGLRLRSIRMPEAFLVRLSAATGAGELAGNSSGRVPNKGMEGLAIAPDGKTLFGLMQSPLLQDHAVTLDGGKTAVGINTRLIAFDLSQCSGAQEESCPSRQFVYQQSTPATGNSEMLAINDHQFLVMERDGKAGDASIKLVTMIDLDGATDVSSVQELPAKDLPPLVNPVAKRVLFDLAATLKAAGQPIVEKYEGLAFGPDLPDGRHLLLITVDNDFEHNVPSRLYAFAFDPSDMPGFKQQGFGPGR